MWKVYNIETGRIMKAGFETDEQAAAWLERRKDLPEDEYDVAEMDEEEEEEFLESEEESDEDSLVVGRDYEPELDDDETGRDPLGGDYDDVDDDGAGDEDEDDDDDDEEDDDEEEEDDDDY